VILSRSSQRRCNEVPEGAYKLQLVVTKALAEAGDPAHIVQR
jgi:hypothetical protein